MKIAIKTIEGVVLHQGEASSFKEFVVANKGSLAEASLHMADLQGVDLARANLIYANLTRADISYANLAGANLTGANLGGANLSGASLAGANLFRTNLYGACLVGANLSGADLREADLGGIVGLPAHVKQIKGSRHIVTMLSDDNVSIGCRRDTLAWWLENYRKIGEKEGYNSKQIAEYGDYLNALNASNAL